MTTPRARFITALERKPLSGRVPHFELVFFLTMEAFGKVHPSHRDYSQWLQMTERERQLHRADMGDLYLTTAERYEHSAICLHPNPDGLEETLYLIDYIRDKTGDRYFLMRHGDATLGIPDGGTMADFCYRMADEPEKLTREAQARVDEKLRTAEALARHGGLDGFALCTDYCLTRGLFSALPSLAILSRRFWRS